MSVHVVNYRKFCRFCLCADCTMCIILYVQYILSYLPVISTLYMVHFACRPLETSLSHYCCWSNIFVIMCNFQLPFFEDLRVVLTCCHCKQNTTGSLCVVYQSTPSTPCFLPGCLSHIFNNKMCSHLCVGACALTWRVDIQFTEWFIFLLALGLNLIFVTNIGKHIGTKGTYYIGREDYL